MSSDRFTKLDAAAAMGMFIYASSVVATPIILLKLAGELGFGLAEGGGIEAVRALFLMAILVSSGTAAARFGKTATLAAGSFVLGIGLISYGFAPAYWFVLVAVVLVGLGGGILEALLNPLVQDEHPSNSGRYLNIVNAFFSVGVLTSVLVVGELLTQGVSWRVLIACIGAGALVVGTLFTLFGRTRRRERRRQRRALRDTSGAMQSANPEPNRARGTMAAAKDILGRRKFWLFAVAMFCGGGAEGAFTFWSATYVQLHFNALARSGAFATAAFAGGMVVGRLASGRFVKQEKLSVLIVASAIFGVFASLGAWASGSRLTFFAVVFAAGLSIACFWPSIQSHAAAVMPVDSTMLLILLSVAGIPGFGLTSWLMGIVADWTSLRTSLLVIPAELLVLALVMIWADRTTLRVRDRS
jgi:fucose permease